MLGRRRWWGLVRWGRGDLVALDLGSTGVGFVGRRRPRRRADVDDASIGNICIEGSIEGGIKGGIFRSWVGGRNGGGWSGRRRRILGVARAPEAGHGGGRE